MLPWILSSTRHHIPVNLWNRNKHHTSGKMSEISNIMRVSRRQWGWLPPDAGELEGLIIQLASVMGTKKRLFVHVFLVPHALTHTNRWLYKASSSCVAIVDGPPMLSRAVASRAFIARGTGQDQHFSQPVNLQVHQAEGGGGGKIDKKLSLYNATFKLSTPEK